VASDKREQAGSKTVGPMALEKAANFSFPVLKSLHKTGRAIPYIGRERMN